MSDYVKASLTPEEDEALRQLREPFPAEVIGKNQDGLDFVGHAAVTDRLLEVDPGWSWEPFAVDDQGLPAVAFRSMGMRKDKRGNEYELKFATMWLRLTVCGVSRPGVGGVDVYPWTTDIEKLLISDAIKNGAMRFGVALDLWSKEDLHAEPPEPTLTEAEQGQIKKLFASLEGDALATAKALFGNALSGSKLEDVPVSQFDAVYAAAMDAVEQAVGE